MSQYKTFEAQFKRFLLFLWASYAPNHGRQHWNVLGWQTALWANQSRLRLASLKTKNLGYIAEYSLLLSCYSLHMILNRISDLNCNCGGVMIKETFNSPISNEFKFQKFVLKRNVGFIFKGSVSNTVLTFYIEPNIWKTNNINQFLLTKQIHWKWRSSGAFSSYQVKLINLGWSAIY